MAITVADDTREGFYLDPESKKTFFAKRVKKILLIPPWVKTKKEDWKPVKLKK